jgi:hypothetical protein
MDSDFSQKRLKFIAYDIMLDFLASFTKISKDELFKEEYNKYMDIPLFVLPLKNHIENYSKLTPILVDQNYKSIIPSNVLESNGTQYQLKHFLTSLNIINKLLPHLVNDKYKNIRFPDHFKFDRNNTIFYPIVDDKRINTCQTIGLQYEEYTQSMLDEYINSMKSNENHVIHILLNC